MAKKITIPILKVKRGDKIELFNGIKTVDYFVHYPKSECVQLTYMDGSITWCTNFQEIEVIRPSKTITFYFQSTDFVDYDKPYRMNFSDFLTFKNANL